MYLYLFTSTAWKFICTVCSTDYITLIFTSGRDSTISLPKKGDLIILY